MLQLILKMLPLELASALSPGILAFALIILSGNLHPKLKCFVFFLGNFLVAIMIAAFGLSAGGGITDSENPTLLSAIIDLIFATLFFFYGIYILLKPEKPAKIQGDPNNLYLKLFIFGFLIAITNLDAVILYLTATKEIGISPLSFIDKIIAVFIGLFFFVSPALIPLLFYIIAPNLAGRVLEPINKFTHKYARYIVGIIFIIFSIYFYIKGFKFF